MAGQVDFSPLLQPPAPSPYAQGMSRVGSVIDAIIARREAQKQWQAEQDRLKEAAAAQLEQRKDESAQRFYQQTREREIAEAAAKQRQRESEERDRDRDEKADQGRIAAYHAAIEKGMDPAAARAHLGPGIQIRDVSGNPMDMLGAPAAAGPTPQQIFGEPEPPPPPSLPSSIPNPRGAWLPTGATPADAATASRPSAPPAPKGPVPQEMVLSSGATMPYVQPQTKEEKAEAFVQEHLPLHPGFAKEIDLAAAAIRSGSITPQRANQYIQKRLDHEYNLAEIKARPPSMAVINSGLNRDLKEAELENKFDVALGRILKDANYKGVMNEENALAELQLLNAGAPVGTAFATLLRGRFARWGQGPGVLTKHDLDTFYNDMGGLAAKWGTSVQNLLSGEITKERQEDVGKVLDAMKRRASLREDEVGRRILANQSRFGGLERTERYLETNVPNFYQKYMAKKDPKKVQPTVEDEAMLQEFEEKKKGKR